MEDGRTTWKRRSLPALRAQRRVLRVVWSPDRTAIGRALELDGTTWTIGREGEGPGRVADRTMSRKHARLVPHASKLGYLVEDLGGSNGTFLDGHRVKKPEVLSTRAVLAFGETVWCMDAEPEPDDLPIAAGIDEAADGALVGVSLAAARLRKAAASAGSTRGAVLLLGPSGVGKDVMARELHRLSGREPFVAVNCATIAPELADSHLFGHHKGSFTGADRERGGLFRRASGGTLFLDEVGELPAAVQAKLLRTLEEGVIEPVGADAASAVDVRVVAATNRDVTQPGFRADLYARLADWVFRVPPLFERRADVVPLFLRFLGGARSMTADFVEALLLHDWPLNVRELQKLAQRLAITVPAEVTLDLEHLPRALVDPIAGRDEPPPEGEREPPAVAALEQALRRAKGNVKQAADDHGWHRTQLYRWLRRAGLDPDEFRE